MIKVIEAQNRLAAWLQAVDYLVDRKHSLNLTLAIATPGEEPGNRAEIAKRLNTFFELEKEDPLHTVAETIFPAWQYRRRGLRGLFNKYEEEYLLLKKGEPSRWGTYAMRLLFRKDNEGNVVRPLEQLIVKMKDEATRLQSGGSKRACYELGICEGAYDLPLYNTIDDLGRRRGLPCLSHLSFKLYDGQVHLTALYRSHDYRHKVLGNLLGLARLQACVAHEVGVPMGTLIVHSTYAFLEKGKERIKKLSSEVKALMAPHQEALEV